MLWVYRTNFRSSIRATPYKIVYWIEVVMPLELSIPSLRIALKGLISDDIYKKKILQETYINSLEHLQA
jgi:hypothetical protein